MRARAQNGLRRYSHNNQLLIALRRPEASYVCGFKASIELGYCVRKGERAIRILAPMKVNLVRILAPMKVNLADDDPATSDPRGNGEPARVFFRAVPVFHRSQADPLPDRDPGPLQPPSAPITGDSHAHLIPLLDAVPAELGYRVCERDDTGAAGGWCNADHRVIVCAGVGLDVSASRSPTSSGGARTTRPRRYDGSPRRSMRWPVASTTPSMQSRSAQAADEQQSA